MAKYTVRIEGDKSLYPVLLSNGNLIEQGDLDGNKHYAVRQDPFVKPCYLFALVVGQLESRDDTFTTRSGRKVSLRIWTPAQDLPKTAHAMYSLKAAMKWDEDFLGSNMTWISLTSGMVEAVETHFANAFHGLCLGYHTREFSKHV